MNKVIPAPDNIRHVMILKLVVAKITDEGAAEL